MKYVDKEEFTLLSDRVKKFLISKWIPSTGDLFKLNVKNDTIYTVLKCDGSTITTTTGSLIDKSSTVPLLSESWLREFIESEVGYLDIMTSKKSECRDKFLYKIECYPYKDYVGFGSAEVFEIWESNLFKAYWCIVKEVANSLTKPD